MPVLAGSVLKRRRHLPKRDRPKRRGPVSEAQRHRDPALALDFDRRTEQPEQACCEILRLWRDARVLALVPFFLFLPIPLPAGLLLVMWLVLQFFTPNTGVAWVAHVGGFAFGALVALLLRKVKPPKTARFFDCGAP